MPPSPLHLPQSPLHLPTMTAPSSPPPPTLLLLASKLRALLPTSAPLHPGAPALPPPRSALAAPALPPPQCAASHPPAYAPPPPAAAAPAVLQAWHEAWPTFGRWCWT